MSRLETLVDDESFGNHEEDLDAVVEAMLDHKDLIILCQLVAKGLIGGDEVTQTMENIYEDAKAHVDAQFLEEDDSFEFDER